MTRILVLTGSFLPQIGGAELAVHNLCQGLVNLDQEVLVGTPTSGRKDEFQYSYSLTRYFTPRGLYRSNLIDYWMVLCISRQISNWKPDAIIANFAWPVGYAALLARGDSSIPVVVISHGADILRVPSINYGMRLKPHLDKKIQWTVCHASGLIAISDQVLGEYLKIGADPRKIRNIPDAINYDALSLSMPDARKRLGIAAGNRKVILAVGRNHPIKGFSDLIHMMPVIIHDVPNALLVIVGKDVPRLSWLVEAEGLSDYVRLIDEKFPVGIECMGPDLGFDQRIGSYYKSSDVYAMPSISEGLGMVALEAMAAGLPVVAYSMPATTDSILDGLTGRLVPYGDKSSFSCALIELLQQDEQRVMMGRNATAFANQFSQEIIAKRVIDFLDELKRMR